jgi:sulfite exporter TauE/SafE
LLIGTFAYLNLDNQIKEVYGNSAFEMMLTYIEMIGKTEELKGLGGATSPQFKLFFIIVMILIWPAFTLMTTDDMQSLANNMKNLDAEMSKKLENIKKTKEDK